MDTVQQFARRASKVLFGDDEAKSGEEPVSGQMGNVAAGEPYDAGNIEPDKPAAPSTTAEGQAGPTGANMGSQTTSTHSTTSAITTTATTIQETMETIGKAAMATAAAMGITSAESASKSAPESEATTQPGIMEKQPAPIEQHHTIPRKAVSPSSSAASAGPAQMSPSALPIRGDSSKPRSNNLPIRAPSDQPVMPTEASPTTTHVPATMADTPASPRDTTSTRVPSMTGPAGRTDRTGMAETTDMPGTNDEMAPTSTPSMTTRAPAAASTSSPSTITTPPTTTSTSPPSMTTTSVTSPTTTRSPMATTTTTSSPMTTKTPDTTTTSTSSVPIKAPANTPKSTPSQTTPSRTSTSTSPTKPAAAQTKSMLDDEDEEVREVKLTGPGPRPLEELAREHGGDAGNLTAPEQQTTTGGDLSGAAGKNRRDSGKSLGGEGGTGEEYVKSSGLAADGGNFDAAKPGAGREADRLLETKGVHRFIQHPHDTHDGGEVHEGHENREHHEHHEHHEVREAHDALAREKVKLKDKIKAALHKGTPSST